jgi:hypothetical protein
MASETLGIFNQLTRLIVRGFILPRKLQTRSSQVMSFPLSLPFTDLYAATRYSVIGIPELFLPQEGNRFK